MSGGISALRGFDYQATVILDLLFDHFDRHGAGASIRPEGEDDLDLRWTEAGVDRKRFVQIKKLTEDILANPNPSTWSLADVVRKLLSDAVSHLAGNDHEQVWVLGDEVEAPVRELIEAGREAPARTPRAYWTAIHGLARTVAQASLPAKTPIAMASVRWGAPELLPGDSFEAQSALAAAAATFGQRYGSEGAAFDRRYTGEVARFHAVLPEVLSRIRILDANGSELEVAERVMQRLEQRYGLHRTIIEHTLFRNLRGFINDIAKQPARSFDQNELETELRCVWPQMVPIKTPPPLDGDHLRRPTLTASLIEPWAGTGVEMVGISGSGKTRLAAEVLERSQLTHPDRIAVYAEVRAGVSLRDCLVGTAFHLRRLGIPEPFAVAVQPGQADEGILSALAKAFSESPNECLLVLDFVEGSDPPGFARDLASFIRALSSGALRLIVFGQERGLRELTALEQMQFGVRSLDAPGLSFAEFVTLIERRHAQFDREKLWSIYQRITAGRTAGLNVSLAQALTRVQTTDEMAAIAARPDEERLAYAERSRFGRVTVGARPGAEKLTCFALPFRKAEAEAIFLNDNIGLAILELLDLGLLRRHDSETFEMHETVRAGLEGLIAPLMRRSAHRNLAVWYRDQHQATAAIFHLDRAGMGDEARALARETFLSGDSWAALWPYVVRHGLLSANEVVSLIAGPVRVESAYLLVEIFKKLNGSPETLMDVLREQSERMFSDSQWAQPILRALVKADPTRLDDLIQLAIKAAPNPEAAADALTGLSIAARRRKGIVAPSTLALLDNQPDPVQKSLIGLLLHADRSALRAALHHLRKHSRLIDTKRGDGWPTLHLDIGSSEDVADLLSAIPTESPVDMVRARGPLLGPLGGLIWRARKALRGHCVDVLRAQTLDSDSHLNAIRILIYLGEPTIVDLCGTLRDRPDSSGNLANLICAIVPALVDWRPYEERVLDRLAEFQARSQALICLAWSGSRLDDVLERLQAIENSDWQRWAPVLRIIAIVTPFAAAIPVLEDALASEDYKRETLLSQIIARQGRRPGTRVTAALLRALAHRSPPVRLSAAVTLGARRDRAALPGLIEQYRREEDSKVQAVIASAIVASGANTAVPLTARTDTPATELWWTILAHRTRDLGAADKLVSIAIDQNRSWLIRRAAIAAAGRLPYETALVRIEPSVMAERSPILLDHNRSLLVHDAVASILPNAAIGLVQFFRTDREGFIRGFEPYFESFWKRTSDRTGLPSGADAAGWLHDALVRLQLPSSKLDQLSNSVHIPLLQATVLRSLRLCGRSDRLDANLAAASHVWVAIRALKERLRLSERGPTLGQSLQDLIKGATWSDDRVVKEFTSQLATLPVTGAREAFTAPPPTTRQPAVVLPLTYQAAIRLLSGGTTDSVPDGPLVLEHLTADECGTLIGLADPSNDPERGETVYAHAVSFTTEGHFVTQRRTTYRGASSIHDRLRPAIAVANRFDLPMLWHRNRLEGPLGNTYASEFLLCLAALGDSDRFYAALAEAEDVLLPALCEKADTLLNRIQLDARLIPALTRHLAVGGDDLFKGLCILVKRIDILEIRPVLEGLLQRWVQRFDLQADHPENDEAYSLWHGFARLSEHPRFDMIPDWPQQLASVLQARMAWFHAQSIVRVLERDVGSYTLIEARLFKETNWEHYLYDEVERLDRAAEALFGRVQDLSTP
jgi:hypothetical protein